MIDNSDYVTALDAALKAGSHQILIMVYLPELKLGHAAVHFTVTGASDADPSVLLSHIKSQARTDLNALRLPYDGCEFDFSPYQDMLSTFESEIAAGQGLLLVDEAGWLWTQIQLGLKPQPVEFGAGQEIKYKSLIIQKAAA